MTMNTQEWQAQNFEKKKKKKKNRPLCWVWKWPIQGPRKAPFAKML